jgi:hypothetical protein
MGRLEDLRINAYLSEVARGYTNSAFIAENLFPVIDSELEKVDIFEFNKEAFSVYNTERAIRANSNVVSPKGFNKKSAILTEHDLAYPIDYREEEESKKIKLQLHATNVVTEGLKLKQEKQCADLVQNPDNYPAGNKITLSGNSRFSNYNQSDPVGVIEDAKDAVAGKIAQDPNTMVLGYEAWKILKRHPQIQGLISNNQNKLVTINFLKEIFEIPNIVVGKSVFVNENGDFIKVWGDNIVLAYTSSLSSRTEYDPAFAYTVRKKNALKIDEYTKEGNKVKYIRGTDIYTPFLVGPEAGYLIGSTN